MITNWTTCIGKNNYQEDQEVAKTNSTFDTICASIWSHKLIDIDIDIHIHVTQMWSCNCIISKSILIFVHAWFHTYQGCSCSSWGHSVSVLKSAGKTEVHNFDIRLGVLWFAVQQDVRRLNVAVDHLFSVEVLDGGDWNRDDEHKMKIGLSKGFNAS